VKARGAWYHKVSAGKIGGNCGSQDYAPADAVTANQPNTFQKISGLAVPKRTPKRKTLKLFGGA
jgi:hypothetical protein